MNEAIRKTNFMVDEQLCIGCGVCIDACPMKILKVEEGICVIEKDSICLECGTCLRNCPEDAISIEGLSEKESSSFQDAIGKERIEESLHFTPILKKLTALLINELNPTQSFDYKGMDVREFDDYKIEGQKCYARFYKTDKVEKITISSTNFFGKMTADVLGISPSPEYDIPYFIVDWDESEDHIFFLCDLTPSDDPGRNLEYLATYLYNPLDDLYQKYCEIPGLKNSVFHSVRAIHSPYIITGTIEKNPRENVAMLFNCAVDYLKAWIKIHKEAKPKDPHSDYMKIVHARRKTVSELYHENDPGGGPMKKFLGEVRAKKVLTMLLP